MFKKMVPILVNYGIGLFLIIIGAVTIGDGMPKEQAVSPQLKGLLGYETPSYDTTLIVMGAGLLILGFLWLVKPKLFKS